MGGPFFFVQIVTRDKAGWLHAQERPKNMFKHYLYHKEGLQTHVDYQKAEDSRGMISVTDQLQKMTAKFANRAAKHSKFSKWLKLRPEGELNTRCQKTKYLPVASRTARYGSSPLPYLTAIHNGND